jgi:hypothetical protein
MCDVSIAAWSAAVCGRRRLTTNPKPATYVDDLGFR